MRLTRNAKGFLYIDEQGREIPLPNIDDDEDEAAPPYAFDDDDDEEDFEEADPAALANAREDWRAVAAAGLPAKFWAQVVGRWVQKATSQPGPG